MTNALIYAEIARVADMAGVIVYCTANQENRIADDAVLVPVVEQGKFTAKSGCWVILY